MIPTTRDSGGRHIHWGTLPMHWAGRWARPEYPLHHGEHYLYEPSHRSD